MTQGGVFPRRNLGADAEEWGRTVEDRIYGLENRSSVGEQDLAGLNRNAASTLQFLGNQYQALSDLVAALPKPQTLAETFTGFSVPSAGVWNTIGTLILAPPSPGRVTISAYASGRIVSAGGPVTPDAEIRLVADGVASPEVPGFPAFLSTWTNTLIATWSWDLPVGGTTVIPVALQVKPEAGSAMWPSGTSSTMTFTVTGTFTGV